MLKGARFRLGPLMLSFLTRLTRPTVAFSHDVVMAALSFVVSLYLRVGDFSMYSASFLIAATALFSGIAGVVFWRLDIHRGIWRYASLNDLITIARAATLVILLFLAAMFLTTRLDDLPRSLVFINWFVLMILLAAPRILYRRLKDGRLTFTFDSTAKSRVPVLLAGAGDVAEVFIEATQRRGSAEYHVVGIVDDSPGRIGRFIGSVEVLGALDDLPAVVERLKSSGKAPQRLVVTKATITGNNLAKLVDTADQLGLNVARLPRLTELRTAATTDIDVRPIAIEDLLGRPQTVLDRAAMKALIAGRRVLVTGAGGTIGGELVRQIADLAPARIALLDNSEFNLYSIDLELGERQPGIERTAILADVRDGERMASLIAAERPAIVFHAAALKHVPMVEAHPSEGILTNIIGTRHIADACRQSGVETMVLISTDKAVNPTSVMGASKRLAESWCQALDLEGRAHGNSTRFVTVRFGNVLGSTGSVVPLFQRQLAQGGPLTVTHPDITRYFMTVREAVELVLQASALGAGGQDGGGIYVLDMGEPVKIVDLARRMIRLAGLRPDRDVKIAFTGLRPGEKLNEELFHSAEPLQPTAMNGILLAAPRVVDRAFLAKAIDELAAAARADDMATTLRLIRRLVPEFYGAEAEAPTARPRPLERPSALR
jgi:FlaA1/EpsC-like NDP-sugar epimerase